MLDHRNQDEGTKGEASNEHHTGQKIEPSVNCHWEGRPVFPAFGGAGNHLRGLKFLSHRKTEVSTNLMAIRGSGSPGDGIDSVRNGVFDLHRQFLPVPRQGGFATVNGQPIAVEYYHAIKDRLNPFIKEQQHLWGSLLEPRIGRGHRLQ